MKLNVNDRFFAKARPVWAKGLEEEKNITLGLYRKISYETGKAVLKVAVSGFNIGTYWEIGPQKTLYVPLSLLKK